MMVWLQR